MTLTLTRQCAECTHFDYDVDAKQATCAIGHTVRFYPPTGPLDYEYGWKRKCDDYSARVTDTKLAISTDIKNHLSQVIEVKELIQEGHAAGKREAAQHILDLWDEAWPVAQVFIKRLKAYVEELK